MVVGARSLFGVLMIGTTTVGCHMGLVGMVAGTSYSNGVYRADTIAHELGEPSVRTLGCLDVGLAIIDRDKAEDYGTSLIELHVGNRCNHPEALDFAQIRIEGSDPHGDRRIVTLDDPRREIVKLHVGAGERGKEKIRMNTSAGLVQLTFDLDRIAPDAKNVHPAPVSFTRSTCTSSWSAVTL